MSTPDPLKPESRSDPQKIPWCPGGKWMLCYQIRRRIGEVLLDAPWSSFDLIVSLSMLLMGIHLFLRPTLFADYIFIYKQFNEVATQSSWSITYVVTGVYGLCMVLWPSRPPFLMRLSSRMLCAFFFMLLAFNHLFFSFPTPLSVSAFIVISVAALWGVARTRTTGY